MMASITILDESILDPDRDIVPGEGCPSPWRGERMDVSAPWEDQVSNGACDYPQGCPYISKCPFYGGEK